jgi:hypothetical protein
MNKRRKPHPRKNPLPKGAYRLPEGGIMLKPSKGVEYASKGKQRRLRARSVMREEPDFKRLAILLIDLAKADLAARRAAESATSTDSSRQNDGRSRVA